jgi:hypothetical protein
MDKNYRDSKITIAMHILTTSRKSFRERVQDAMSAIWVAMGCKEGFEDEFETIRRCLRSVDKGDYSRVSDEELTTVAEQIMKMYRQLPEVPLNPPGRLRSSGIVSSAIRFSPEID